MHKQNSNFLSFQRRASVFAGLLLAVFGGFYFFNASAQTAAENLARQNVALGKLAFSAATFYGFGAPDRRIGIADANGSGQTMVPVSSSLSPTEPAWSPDGTRLAFASLQGAIEIYVVNADGSGLIRLTNTENIQERNPSWSVTGKIAYARNPQQTTGQIWVMNEDGSGQMPFPGITQPFPFDPAWSPDGTKIAFVSGGEIWTINADGTNQRRVTNNAMADTEPAWSPDGSKIVFAKGANSLGVINADGTNEITLLGGSDNFIQPAWSPDGTKIAFRRTGGDGNRGIYTIDSNGANQTLIIADAGVFPNPQTSFENPAWQPLRAPRATPFDFDGDAKADVAVFRPSAGVWFLLNSTTGFAARQWGLSTDVLVPADYDGDLKTDYAVWRPSNGNFYIVNSFDNTVRIENFGLADDVPTGGDWDGDGKADLAVYRAGAQSVFYYRGSMGNPQGNISSVPWGTTGDKAVAGDYDGDGRTDAAVYRNGIWYVRQSSNGQLFASSFGLSTDTLVPADYDADGKTDLAVYRGGVWYISRSAQGFTAFQFGISTDVPAPADYDGDGRADAAVFRNGVWWILKTQTGAAEAVSFGSSGDAPVSSAFVR